MVKKSGKNDDNNIDKDIKGGENMDALAFQSNVLSNTRCKLDKLKNKSKSRKCRIDLRHTPNKSDVNTANQNSRDLFPTQCKSIK